MEPSNIDHWWHIDALFVEALDLPPHERAAFLDDACNGDTGLRHEVEPLLTAHAACDDLYVPCTGQKLRGRYSFYEGKRARLNLKQPRTAQRISVSSSDKPW